MSMTNLDSRDYDRFLTLTEKAERENAVAANDAFAKAMGKAIKRGREKVKAGTFVDLSTPVSARRIRGEHTASSCGSPAAMCADSSQPGGAL
jgi:hypothetical protein